MPTAVKPQQNEKVTLTSREKLNYFSASRRKASAEKKLEVLFQRLGKKLYAFTISEDDVYWSEVLTAAGH